MTEENKPTVVDSEEGPPKKKRKGTALIAHLLDNVIPIPGTKFRFGLDALVGLIPGYGDAATTVIGSTIMVQAARSGVPRRIVLAMAANQMINGTIGAIPGVGDAFSAFFKSNARNYALLCKWEGTRDASFIDKLFVGTLVFVLLAITVTAVLATWFVLRTIVLPLLKNAGAWPS